MSEFTGFTFPSTKRDKSIAFVSFGDPDGLPINLAEIGDEDDSDTIAARVALVFDSTMTLDDKINLVHTICHSAKYAGLVKSATI